MHTRVLRQASSGRFKQLHPYALRCGGPHAQVYTLGSAVEMRAKRPRVLEHGIQSLCFGVSQ